MNLFIILVQLIFTVPLFCIMEYFGKKEISTVQKVLIPVVYILILSGFCEEIRLNIYLIVIFEVILHEFYTNYLAARDILVNKKEYFINALISIIISIFVYDYYISQVDSIFPLPSEFRSLLWFLVVIFIYGLFKNNISKIDNNKKRNFIDRKREYVVVMYAKLKNKYYKVIKSKTMFINRLVYAIMIYENYNNPPFYRKFVNIMNRFVNKEMRYGIMQVESDKEIDDEKSIKLSISKLEKSYSKLDKNLKDKEVISLLLYEKYDNQDYINDIIDIYEEIIEFENR